MSKAAGKNVARTSSAEVAEVNRRRAEAIDRHVEELQDAAGGDLAKAEKSASGTIVLGTSLPVLVCGALLVLVALFMPHSGQVHGYDVLLYTDRAQEFITTLPERVYIWLALVGGVLLTFGTVFSRSSLVAWVNWGLAGIGWFYSVLAIGMRQSRPPTEPGDGPSFGLVMGFIGMLLVFVTLCTRLLRRGAVQKAIASRRRDEADLDEKTRSEQLVLRTGLPAIENADIVDDRRDKARARREARKKGPESDSDPGTPE